MVAAQLFVYRDRAQVTVSVGVAAVTDVGMREPAELIGAADDALYHAKRSGGTGSSAAGSATPRRRS